MTTSPSSSSQNKPDKCPTVVLNGISYNVAISRQDAAGNSLSLSKEAIGAIFQIIQNDFQHLSLPPSTETTFTLHEESNRCCFESRKLADRAIIANGDIDPNCKELLPLYQSLEKIKKIAHSPLKPPDSPKPLDSTESDPATHPKPPPNNTPDVIATTRSTQGGSVLTKKNVLLAGVTILGLGAAAYVGLPALAAASALFGAAPAVASATVTTGVGASTVASALGAGATILGGAASATLTASGAASALVGTAALSVGSTTTLAGTMGTALAVNGTASALVCPLVSGGAMTVTGTVGASALSAATAAVTAISPQISTVVAGVGATALFAAKGNDTCPVDSNPFHGVIGSPFQANNISQLTSGVSSDSSFIEEAEDEAEVEVDEERSFCESPASTNTSSTLNALPLVSTSTSGPTVVDPIIAPADHALDITAPLAAKGNDACPVDSNPFNGVINTPFPANNISRSTSEASSDSSLVEDDSDIDEDVFEDCLPYESPVSTNTNVTTLSGNIATPMRIEQSVIVPADSRLILDAPLTVTSPMPPASPFVKPNADLCQFTIPPDHIATPTIVRGKMVIQGTSRLTSTLSVLNSAGAGKTPLAEESTSQPTTLSISRPMVVKQLEMDASGSRLILRAPVTIDASAEAPVCTVTPNGITCHAASAGNSVCLQAP